MTLEYTININGRDVSQMQTEVVSSAIRILLLSGLSNGQIAEILRAASEVIVAGDTMEEIDVSMPDDEDSSGLDHYDLSGKFDELPAIKSLNRLAKRTSNLNDLSDAADLAKALEAVAQAIPLRIEALLWLQQQAAAAGIQTALDQDSWIATASDDELDRQDEVLFFDDYSFSTDFDWHMISSAASALANGGRISELNALYDAAHDPMLALDSSVKRQVAEAREAGSHYHDFQSYVRQHAGHGPLNQSEFIEGFIRPRGLDLPGYVMNIWLDDLDARGEIRRFKLSNRWKIEVN